jgi:hypothetical protein
MLSILLARSRLITNQSIRYTRFLLSPPTPPTLAFADFPPHCHYRRHGELPVSLMIKYGTPRQDLHRYLACGAIRKSSVSIGTIEFVKELKR